MTPSSTVRLSTVARRTGITITRDNQPIDAAALAAIGWVVNPQNGTAHWADPDLGNLSVTWEVPQARASYFTFELEFWGEVTGANLAMAPYMYPTVFTGDTVETSAHSVGGVRTDAPAQVLSAGVPEQPVGTTAGISINLGWPVPVLVTYHYVYVAPGG